MCITAILYYTLIDTYYCYHVIPIIVLSLLVFLLLLLAGQSGTELKKKVETRVHLSQEKARRADSTATLMYGGLEDFNEYVSCLCDIIYKVIHMYIIYIYKVSMYISIRRMRHTLHACTNIAMPI